MSALTPRLLDAKDAANYLGISPKKLTQLANDGEVVRVYIGNRPKYERASLDEYIDNLPAEIA